MVASEEPMSTAARKRAASVTIALVMIAFGSRALLAQAPTVIMFYGGDLKAPVLLTDAAAAAFRNLLSEATITVKELGDRPFTPVALFWASRLDPAANGTRIPDLKPAMAWQHGRLYRPLPDKPAVLLVTRMTKGAQPVPLPSNGAAFIWGGPVSEAGLAVLRRTAILR
jgi:hypothetical protein